MNIPFFSKTKEVATIPIDYAPSIYHQKDVGSKLSEQYKGEVESKKVMFPTELGEEHPFNFKTMEDLYKKFGFFTAVVDKYIDFIVGPGFYIECKEPRAKEILEQFMKDVNFDTLLRQWTKEALVKGNGFLEIGGNKKEGIKGLKMLNSSYMYILRDKKGKIEGYNQYKGAFDKFAKEKVISFNENEIAHVPFNVIGDCAYGFGIGYTAMKLVDDWLNMNNSEHKLMDRKANAPLHAKFGYINGDTKIIPKSEDVQAFGKDLETMNNKTEWVTDPLVEFKVVDFGNIGEKFAQTKESDLEMLIYAFQIPAVLLGKANIPEGLAKVQMEAFQRRIQSIQAELEKIIEQKIFKVVLNANGFEVDVEFEWGTPSVMETEGRMKLISDMIKSSTVSGAMNIMLEDEMINLLGFDKGEWEKLKLEQAKNEEEERKRLESQATPIVPGQNKNFPQKVQPKAEQPKQPKPQEMIQMIDDILSSRKLENKEITLNLSHPLVNVSQPSEINPVKEDELKALINELKEKQENDRKMFEERIKQKEIEKIDKIDDSELKNMIKQMNIDFTNERKNKDEQIASLIIKLQELEIINSKIKERPTKKRFRNVKSKYKSLLPEFRISKSEEIVKPKKEQGEKRKNENYEHEKACSHVTEGWENFNTIEEWTGFNYKSYLGEIMTILSGYDFEQIKALNAIELEAGYLSELQVAKLKSIMTNGFEKGLSMKEMAKQVDAQVELKDLYRMTEEGSIKKGVSGLPILSKSKEKRAIGIVRTEVTRVANAGAVEYYKHNEIANVKWIASVGERTCTICESLNGQIFEINSVPAIPAHTMCRCTVAPVVELK